MLVTSIFSFSHNIFHPSLNVVKGENADNQHFLIFPQYFSPFLETIFHFSVTFILSSANAINLDYSKNLLFDKDWKRRGGGGGNVERNYGIVNLYQTTKFYTGSNWEHLQTTH